MPPSRVFPPVEFCRGTKPSQAANSRPERNTFGVGNRRGNGSSDDGPIVWDGEAQRLGGLEIDDQLKLCRHLQWKIGRLLTLEDAVDVPCRQAKLFAANVTIG